MRTILLTVLLIGCATSPRPSTEPASLAAAQKTSADKELVRRVVQEHFDEVTHCYEQELAKTPTLAGKVLLSFKIGAHGVVTAAQASQGFDSNVESCLVSLVKQLSFPSLATAELEINYPFEFKATTVAATPAPAPEVQ
jgi:hypothetical protein